MGKYQPRTGDMNMTFALLACFNSPTVPLREICKEYLGIEPKTAEQKAKAAALPFPTFKLRDSERAPTMVNVTDLGAYLQSRYDQARDEWQHVND
ncbi:pyocin activator PrtN family protein [Pseudoalteromonas ruthenica]|uniref:pyocin activator PrtN family protein n=1 Tax=Pseudoalteromonas ruthenica TaxID=151081 RepID=UPI0003490503|nr:pyocin activator PrtN family protein [Pseudoalteromonas ruthenica]